MHNLMNMVLFYEFGTLKIKESIIDVMRSRVLSRDGQGLFSFFLCTEV